MARCGGMSERQPDVQWHDAGFRTSTDQGQEECQAAMPDDGGWRVWLRRIAAGRAGQ